MYQISKILVALAGHREGRGLAEESDGLARQAGLLAKTLDATVTLAHVGERAPAEQGPVRDALERTRQRLAADGVRVELCMRAGRPWEALVELVREEQPSLLMIAKRRAPRWGEHRLGPNAVKLLRYCPCPVWAAEPEETELPKHILAANDLTDTGVAAVRMGAALAAAFGARLTQAHVWQLPFEFQMERSHVPDETHAQHIKDYEAQLEQKAKATLPEGVDAELWMACDAPAPGLLRAVEELNAELVVLGCASRTGLQGFIVGNTAERLLPVLQRSMVVIKPAGGEAS